MRTTNKPSLPSSLEYRDESKTNKKKKRNRLHNHTEMSEAPRLLPHRSDEYKRKKNLNKQQNIIKIHHVVNGRSVLCQRLAIKTNNMLGSITFQ